MDDGRLGGRQDFCDPQRRWSSQQEDALGASSGGYATPTKRTALREPLSLDTTPTAPATSASKGTPRNPQETLPPAAHSGCPICARLSAALKLLSGLQRDELVQRAHLDSEERLHEQQLEHLVKLQAKFGAIITAAVSRGKLDELPAELSALNLEIQEIHHLQLAQREYVIVLRKELRKHVYRQATKQEKVYESIFSNDAAESNAATQIMADVQPDDVSITSRQASSVYSTLVQEYYEKAGDFSVAQDMLIVFEEGHQEEALDRQKLKEAGAKLMPSQKIFMENYFDRRAELIRNYLRAKHDRDQLKQQCLAQGYTLDHDSVDERLDTGNLDHSNRVRGDTLTQNLRPQRKANRRLDPIELLLIPTVYAEDRVQGWRVQIWKAWNSKSYYDPWTTVPDHERVESKEPFRSEDLDSSTNIDGKWDHSTFEATSDAASDRGPEVREKSTDEWPGESLRQRYSSPELFDLSARTERVPPNTNSLQLMKFFTLPHRTSTAVKRVSNPATVIHLSFFSSFLMYFEQFYYVLFSLAWRLDITQHCYMALGSHGFYAIPGKIPICFSS